MIRSYWLATSCYTWLHGVHTYSSITIINPATKSGTETATPLCSFLKINKTPPSVNTFSSEAHRYLQISPWCLDLDIVNQPHLPKPCCHTNHSRAIDPLNWRQAFLLHNLHSQQRFHTCYWSLDLGLINQTFSLSHKLCNDKRFSEFCCSGYKA